ncbi:MAG TPA: DUF1330 domain-containing protein [Stellaceae bacterium]|nr:DUF1330 domain-containing protein [Stellaceae bacterium]
MTAYVIVDLDVKDLAALEGYRRDVPATVAKYGGRFLVRGGASETLEGDWAPKRMVMLEFPSMDALKRWYHSEEYKPLIKLRQAHSTGDLIAVEGV